MLILHTSDWHLGRSLHGADLSCAFELWCKELIKLVKERQIDAVLISGDIYDRAVPPTWAVELFDRTLTELSEITNVIISSGNHDSPQRLGFGADLMRKGKVHIFTLPDTIGTPVEIFNKSGQVEALVYPIPYLDPDVARVPLAKMLNKDEPLARSHQEVMSAALELVKRDIETGLYAGQNNIARIVMAHAFVTGGEASDSERDISVGGVDSIPSSLFRLTEPVNTGKDISFQSDSSAGTPLDYVALGHLHSPQKVGGSLDPLMRYSGSPIVFSFDENKPKSSALLTINEGDVDVELIPAPVWRHTRTFMNTLEELEKQSREIRQEDQPFARVIVTDPSRPSELNSRIRRLFPHLLHLQHRSTPMESKEKEKQSISLMKPQDLLLLFMEKSGNRALSEEEKSIVNDVWETVQREEK